MNESQEKQTKVFTKKEIVIPVITISVAGLAGLLLGRKVGRGEGAASLLGSILSKDPELGANVVKTLNK